jgi:chorismate mutase/prephenate dehydratase
MRIYYFGPEGSFSEEAALQRFGRRGEYFPIRETFGVFRAVKKDPQAIGVVPIENSARGAVYEVVDQVMLDDFSQSGLSILEELSLPIVLSLLVNPRIPRTQGRGAGNRTSPRFAEASRKIKRVYSNPIPLSFCRDWVQDNIPGAKLTEKVSTSEAAQAAQRDEGGAAIANLRAARIYNLKVLLPEIENLGTNITNFLVIGRKPGRPTAKDKTGIVFSLEHRPGSLYRALGVLHRNKINMTKIISRPKPQMIGEYNFFVEVEGHRNNPRIKEALRRLLRHTLTLTVAGSYPLIKLK